MDKDHDLDALLQRRAVLRAMLGGLGPGQTASLRRRRQRLEAALAEVEACLGDPPTDDG